MEPLVQLRGLIAALDETVVDALCARAGLRRNEALYPQVGPPAPALAALAGLFTGAASPSSRVQVLRPAYLQVVLPVLCEPGRDAGQPAPFAADAACLDTLARRLSLSVHVATRKREAVPEALRAALATRDPVQVEQAITHPAVEAEVLARVRNRVSEKQDNPNLPGRIARVYAEWIIPLSRKIQVHGLLDREPAPRRQASPDLQ